MVALPALAHPWTRRITGDDTIAIGHFATAGYIAAGAAGVLSGRKSPSTEDPKLPEGLRFLRDSMVATALSMAIMYVVLAVPFLVRAGSGEAFAAFPDGATNVGNYLMQAVTQGFQFGVAVAVILFGVRTILCELVPAFQGIAQKVIPGAIPALDAPIVFPYAQNAVLLGGAIVFQRRAVDSGWDPAPGRPRVAAAPAEASDPPAAATRTFAKIPPPRGAPAPPPQPAR